MRPLLHYTTVKNPNLHKKQKLDRKILIMPPKTPTNYIHSSDSTNWKFIIKPRTQLINYPECLEKDGGSGAGYSQITLIIVRAMVQKSVTRPATEINC